MTMQSTSSRRRRKLRGWLSTAFRWGLVLPYVAAMNVFVVTCYGISFLARWTTEAVTLLAEGAVHSADMLRSLAARVEGQGASERSRKRRQAAP